MLNPRRTQLSDPTLSTISRLFRTNDSLFHKALEGVSPDHLRQRPSDQSNPMIWIACHLTYSRAAFARMTGTQIEQRPWLKLFHRGAKIEDLLDYPQIEEVIAAWKEASDILSSRMPELTEEELSKPGSFEVPSGDQTMRGAIAFLMFHETYHVGQLAYLRKWLGYSQLVG